MNNLHFHSDQNLAAEIEAYLTGNMSAEEMHRLEKAMLENPFLADAVEGLALIESSTKRQQALHAIRQKLRNGKEKKKMLFGYQRYAAAAAMLLIFGSVFLLKDYFFNNENTKPVLSEVQKNETEEPAALGKDNKGISEKNITANKGEITGDLTKDQISESEKQEGQQSFNGEVSAKSATTRKQQRSPSGFSSRSKKPIVAEQPTLEGENMPITESAEEIEEIPIAENNTLHNEVGLEMDTDEAFSDDTGFALEDSLRMVQQEVTTAKTEVRRVHKKKLAAIYDNQKVQRQIKGTITDAEKNPLPGVSVLVKGNAQGVVTDINGKFILLASAADHLLYVNFSGIEDEEVVLEEGDNEVQIAIDEELETFSEVVISGFMQKRPLNRKETGAVTKLDREDLGLPTIVTYASPKGGMKAFKAHLEVNMSYPARALKENIKGKVKLGFIVTKNGKVKDIQVLRPLGYGCDEEAVRLLKTGPDWFPKTVEDTPETSGRTIKIRFK